MNTERAPSNLYDGKYYPIASEIATFEPWKAYILSQFYLHISCVEIASKCWQSSSFLQITCKKLFPNEQLWFD